MERGLPFSKAGASDLIPTRRLVLKVGVLRPLSWRGKVVSLRSAFLLPLPSSSLGVTGEVVELLSKWVGAEANVRDVLARRNRESGGEQKINYEDRI